MSEGRGRYATGAWLALAALLQAALLAAIYRVFVHTWRGQVAELVAVAGNRIGRDHVIGYVGTVLDAVSVASLAAATLAIAFIALVRRRYALALVATLLVVGTNLATQVLKKVVLDRPDLGVAEHLATRNSFPSGHVTVAASVVAALILVVPPRLRGVTAVVGAGYAGAMGVATLSAGWHRPSDAVGAYLLVGAGAAVAGLVLLVLRRRDERGSAREAHPMALAVLLLVGLGLLAVGAAALLLTVRATTPDTGAINLPLGSTGTGLSTQRLFLAYAGSSAGMAGAASTVMAVLLSTVHRVVPARTRHTRRPPYETRLPTPTRG